MRGKGENKCEGGGAIYDHRAHRRDEPRAGWRGAGRRRNPSARLSNDAGRAAGPRRGGPGGPRRGGGSKLTNQSVRTSLDGDTRGSILSSVGCRPLPRQIRKALHPWNIGIHKYTCIIIYKYFAWMHVSLSEIPRSVYIRAS